MNPPTYAPMQAYNYGVFGQVAYQMFSDNPGNLTPPVPKNFPAGHKLFAYLTAEDKVGEVDVRKFYGYIAQSQSDPNLFVGAVRGTEGVLEWLKDAEFMPTRFTRVPQAGEVEDGFFTIYDSMTAIPFGQQAQQDLPGLVKSISHANLTIAGHSLGSAIASLWALDVAVNTPVAALACYTLASPRVGFRAFVNCFNQNVPQSCRVYNEPDIVPKLPPLYDHVNGGEQIDSKLDPGIKHSILCYHVLVTYLRTLNPKSVFSVDECAKS